MRERGECDCTLQGEERYLIVLSDGSGACTPTLLPCTVTSSEEERVALRKGKITHSRKVKNAREKKRTCDPPAVRLPAHQTTMQRTKTTASTTPRQRNQKHSNGMKAKASRRRKSGNKASWLPLRRRRRVRSAQVGISMARPKTPHRAKE